jgi:hypothetical protein
LGPIFVLLTDAGPVSKTIVCASLLVAYVIAWQIPAWTLAATLIQCAVCIFILLYLQVQR